MSVSGSLITRNYSNFRGVDYSNNEVLLYRSPDSLNMWKNYASDLGKSIETRPDIVLHKEFSNTVFGLFFYKVGNVTKEIVHSGTKLYADNVEIFSGMNPRKTIFKIMNNILYILDGINYLSYDGKTCEQVVGAIPTTSIGRTPGKNGGSQYQDVNLLSPYRINSFAGDGEGKEYYLDSPTIDSDYKPVVTINDEIKTTGWSVDYSKGKITFEVAPAKPYTDGQDNVFIKFKKEVPGYRNRIANCTNMVEFDNRLFFSGNKDYPNALFYTADSSPDYIGDRQYYNDGTDNALIKAMIPGNNALWVIKEPSQANTTIYYHIPTYDADYGMVYPRSHSSISTGCISTGINFNDDIVFYSTRGLEGISGQIESEQVITHRSGFVDSRLIAEENYEDMMLVEYEGYLLTIIDNKVYLADSRQLTPIENHIEYEWYYWELPIKPTSTCVKDDVLYFGTETGIYKLTNFSDDRKVDSYWTTCKDEFQYPQYQKTTNKRGCVLDLIGNDITISTLTDNGTFEEIGTYNEVKEYIVCRIKKKKWKSIQLKISSTTPFKLFSGTLEAYIGGYVKR